MFGGIPSTAVSQVEPTEDAPSFNPRLAPNPRCHCDAALVGISSFCRSSVGRLWLVKLTLPSTPAFQILLYKAAKFRDFPLTPPSYLLIPLVCTLADNLEIPSTGLNEPVHAVPRVRRLERTEYAWNDIRVSPSALDVMCQTVSGYAVGMDPEEVSVSESVTAAHEIEEPVPERRSYRQRFSMSMPARMPRIARPDLRGRALSPSHGMCSLSTLPTWHRVTRTNHLAPSDHVRGYIVTV